MVPIVLCDSKSVLHNPAYLQKKAKVFISHADENVKIDQTSTSLQAAHCHIMSRMWWIKTLMLAPALLSPWCPCVALHLKSSCQAMVMGNPHPPTLSDHLGMRCHFASLFHVQCLCAPSVCRAEWRLNDRFPLRTWHMTLMPGRAAGWEKTPAARHSSQPHQSVQTKADVTALSSLKNLLADIFSFCHTAERSWLSDWLRQNIYQTPSWLRIDG